MQAVKVRIRRGGVGENQMVYPTRYNAQEVDRDGLGPLSVNHTGAYSGHIGKGGTEEWCIIILSDFLAAEYVKDVDMQLVSPEGADVLMEEWRVYNEEPEEVPVDSRDASAGKRKSLKKTADILKAVPGDR